MKKIIQIFLAGVMVVIPFAVTAYVIWAVGAWLDVRGRALLQWRTQWREWQPPKELGDYSGLGILIVLGIIFLIGLLTRSWLFQRILRYFERLIIHMPGVKTIYESMRDLLKLFGRGSERMGRTVLYTPPGSDMSFLGVVTNDQPAGADSSDGRKRVALYLPLAYMLGGPVIFVPEDTVKELNMPVEQALKLCATAHVGVPALEEKKLNNGKLSEAKA